MELLVSLVRSFVPSTAHTFKIGRAVEGGADIEAPNVLLTVPNCPKACVFSEQLDVGHRRNAGHWFGRQWEGAHAILLLLLLLHHVAGPRCILLGLQELLGALLLHLLLHLLLLLEVDEALLLHE